MAVNSALAGVATGRFLFVIVLSVLLYPSGLVFAQSTEPMEGELDEIVVTASGFEQEIKNAPASITILPAVQIQQKRTNSLAELLVDVEGVDVGDNVGKTGGLNISMRGMPSDYTLVLIDGRRQNTAGNITPNGFSETSTSFLPPVAAIERVEIIRGPMSTLYGSDAMGGVINIITKKVGYEWTGSLTTNATVQQETDFGNTYASSATLTGPLVNNYLGVSLRGSLLHRNPSELSPTGVFGENTTISRRGPSPVQADIYTVGGRITFTPTGNHDLWIDAEIARQVYDNSEAQLGTLDRPDQDPPTFNGYGPELRFNRDQVTLAHTWRHRSGVLQSSLMRNKTETLGRTLPPGTPGGPPGSGIPDKPAGAPRTLESTNTVFDTKLTSHLSNHVFSIGGQIWDARMIDGVALEPFEHAQWSVFAEDEWRLLSDVALTLGLRRDDHSAFGGHVSPRAYLVWNTTPSLTLKGGVSRGYKTPSVEQLVDGIIGFTGQGRIATIGSPGLRPETSTSTEISAYYTAQTGLSAGVTLFNNQFDDKITAGTPIPNCTFEGAPNLPGCVNYGDFPTQESFSQRVNVDEAVTRGVETSIRVPFLKIWSVAANHTYTYSKQLSGENEGLPLVNTPKHMLNASLRVQPVGRLNGWLRGEYRSRRTRFTTNSRNASPNMPKYYEAYGLLHLGAGYAVTNNVTVNATVYNLLNTDFLEYVAYQGTPTDDNPTGIMYTNLYNNHQEGRRLWLSVNVQF